MRSVRATLHLLHLPRALVFRYVLLACLFAAAVCYQVGSAVLILQQGSIDLPAFTPATGSAAIGDVEPEGSAAGLHKGDILVAINGRPYTGTAVFWEELTKAVPGSTLAVTVRSPGANLQEHTATIPDGYVA